MIVSGIIDFMSGPCASVTPMSNTQEPRYTTGNFKTDATYRDSDGNLLATLSIGELTDTRTGRVYPDGAHKVILTRSARDLGFRSKTFKGETAWSDAERLIHDVQIADRWR